MGHARTYLTFDIVRRVISNYFGYDVFYVMNITDIDDKIIKRARQNHLYEEYLSKKHPLEKVLVDCNEVMLHFAKIVSTTVDVDKRAMQERLFAKLKAAVEAVNEAVKSDSNEKIRASQDKLLVDAKDLLSDWLDRQYGAQVTDNAIFSKLPKYWEEKYHQDMEALNVSVSCCVIQPQSRIACPNFIFILDSACRLPHSSKRVHA